LPGKKPSLGLVPSRGEEKKEEKDFPLCNHHFLHMVLTTPQKLVKEKEIRSVLGKGRFITTPFFLLKYKPNNNRAHRYGFVVSKKVSQSAVVRNKVKRRMKEIVRARAGTHLHTYDVVVVARKASASAAFAELKSNLTAALHRAIT
jgi:ribonuclease P protein component